LNVSARAYDRILKVSRIVADLAASDSITPEDVSEAVNVAPLIGPYGCEEMAKPKLRMTNE
jgi:hypothetical protein